MDPTDPNNLPPNHPMRKLGTSLGMVQPMPGQAMPGAQGAPQTPSAAHMAAPPRPMGPQPRLAQPQPQLISRQRGPDPLGRPYTLPSGGLLYGAHAGTVIISPMRGEQEEILAGAGEGIAATPALRHVVSQCVDTQGIPYESLELSDWSALLLHVLALSLGQDNIPLYPSCPMCKVQFDGSRPLSQVPCRVLRRAQPGEEPTWPPANAQTEDEDLRILREMGLDGAEADQSAHQVYVAHSLEEPVDIQLIDGHHLGWRYLRLTDLIQAEDFAERSQSTQTDAPGSALHRFVHARQVATLDGKRVGVLDAMQWVKRTPLPVLSDMRAQMERRSFGYELSPSFRCPNGHSFRQQLPLNGAMFRRRVRASIG